MQPDLRSKSSKKPALIFLVIYAVLLIGTIIFAISSRGENSKVPVSISPFAASERDTERETDIKALHAQIEAYWAQVGYYPSLSDLNSTEFVSTNLKGLDGEALRDPLGASYTLAAEPAKNAYSYDVSPESCDNTATMCNDYTLTATLEETINGSKTYTKHSLNSF